MIGMLISWVLFAAVLLTIANNMIRAIFLG
jgi:hypothetical protein